MTDLAFVVADCTDGAFRLASFRSWSEHVQEYFGRRHTLRSWLRESFRCFISCNNSTKMAREDKKHNTSPNSRAARTRSHDQEEECSDKVCSETKSSLNNWLKKDRRSKELDCPLDRNALGRVTWSLLHTMAAAYPVKPSQENKSDMEQFIKLMSVLYPCSYCAKEFREDLATSPPDLDSRSSLSQWFCEMHNKVNARLNKPQFDCRKVDERWRTGWKDGSCVDF